MLRLWYHECCRVFQDRLVNDDDRSWFDLLLKRKIEEFYNIKVEEALGEEAILFSDFLDSSGSLARYEQVKDFHKLTEALENNLNEYNLQSTKPMKLVLFLDAISHICRISRIIRQPMGNALLLGMGGSGQFQKIFIIVSVTNFVFTFHSPVYSYSTEKHNIPSYL